MVIVARSRSVHGPWENHPGNPIARTTDAAERWWSRGHATIVPGPAAGHDDWWMLSLGYENGYRTLGRQILLEPIVTGWYRIDGSEWTRHSVRYETSGYHANTIGDLLSLRPAVYAAGPGSIRVDRIAYRALS